MSDVRKVIDNLVHQLWVDHGCPDNTVELDTKRAQAAEKAVVAALQNDKAEDSAFTYEPGAIFPRTPSSLDKRLYQLLDDRRYQKPELPFYGEVIESNIEAIKQAFIDEGWMSPEKFEGLVEERADFNKRWNMMTGPEFLARFEKEYPAPQRVVAGKYTNRINNELNGVYQLAISAARRAAGVDHD